MKIHIHNDGSPAWATTVTDEETGEVITNAFRFDLDMSKGRDIPIANLYVYTPSIDWTGEVDVTGVPDLEASLLTALNAAYFANQRNTIDFRANEALRELMELMVERVTFDPVARVFRPKTWGRT